VAKDFHGFRATAGRHEGLAPKPLIFVYFFNGGVELFNGFFGQTAPPGKNKIGKISR